MFGTVVLAIAVAAILFIGFLLLKAYLPSLFGRSTAYPQKNRIPLVEDMPPYSPPGSPPGSPSTQKGVAEGFQNGAAAAAPQPRPATKMNTPAPPVPAPAPSLTQDAPMVPREVAPGGPGAPAAAPPMDTRASISPETKPLDPYEDSNMEAPIHDSMRYPELSFGPGVENTGFNKLGLSGVGSAVATAGESPFSPEFAQNGGQLMGTVFANDLSKDDRFASA